MARRKTAKTVDPYLGKDSIWKIEGNELLGVGVAIDAYNLIRELEEKLAKLNAEIENSAPVRPFCKTAMKPINFTHYYNPDGTRVWFCNCDDFPESAKAERHHEGY